MNENLKVSELLARLRRYQLMDSFRTPNPCAELNKTFQKHFPGNYTVIEDFDTREGINLIFENEEEKTLWMLKYWN
jgi:hypothetical protein